MEKIAVIGTGNMGRALGIRLAQLGYEVFFGARDIAKAVAASQSAGHDSRGGTLDEAAGFGDVLLWTIRETDPGKVLSQPELLDGKIVMELNNRDYALEVKTGAWFSESIAEKLQNHLPKARVVKVFNTIGMESSDTDPAKLREVGAQTFLAGSDAAAKQTVAGIASALGFQAVDLGSTPASYRAAEALGDVVRLLMIDGQRRGGAHLKLIMLPEEKLGAIGERAPSNYA